MNIEQLKSQFDQKDGKSQRAAGREFGISQSYVCKLLQQCSIDCRKKQMIPYRTEKQASEAKTKFTIISEKYRNKEWIIDDESYFTLGHTSIVGNNYFYSSDVSQTPSNVKFARKSKYEEKLLVWLAMSRKGISRLFTIPSGLGINQEIYSEDCIHKRLIPFIKKYHS